MGPKRDTKKNPTMQQLEQAETEGRARSSQEVPDVEGAKNSLQGYKAAFTASVNRAMKQVAYVVLEDKRTARQASILLSTSTKLEDQFSRVEDGLLYIMEIDPDSFDICEKDLHDHSDKLQAMQNAISDSLETFNQALLTLPSTARGATAPVTRSTTAVGSEPKPGKLMESLRPAKLSEEDTPPPPPPPADLRT